MDYTITITPNDDSGTTTTLTVENSTGEPRITSVLMASPTGLTSGQIPTMDVGLLLQAVTGPTRPLTAITASAPSAAEGTPESADTRPADVDVDEPAATTVTAQASTAETAPPATASDTAPAERANRRRSAEPRKAAGRADTKTAPASGTRGRRSQQPTKTAAPSKAARAQRTAAPAAAGSGTGRAYRRMPEDFAEVFHQASTPAAIMDHYNVPRHTAQGWIKRYTNQQPTTTN